MSFSKKQISSEHRLTRTGSYSTVPFANGRVDVMPKHAKNFEIPCKSVDEIRESLARAARTIDAKISLNPKNKAELIENKKKINQQLTYANSLKKAARSTKVHLSPFLLAARVMLVDSVFEQLHESALCDASQSIKESVALRGLRKKLAVLKDSARLLVSLSLCPDEARRLQGATELEKDRSEINRCADLIEKLKESYVSDALERVAEKELTSESLALIYELANSATKPGETKRIVRAVGGKKQFKSLAGNLYQESSAQR